jgi:hypothetical protein
VSFVRTHVKGAWIIGAFALLANVGAQGAGPALDGLIDSVLRSGRDGELPPHLSLVLGLASGDAPLAVKQAVLRDGSDVRVFNVCVANHKDIVILRTNEQERNTKAYLVSAKGNLRKAVSFEAGGQPQPIPAAQARAATAAEIQFWVGLGQRLAPAPPLK